MDQVPAMKRMIWTAALWQLCLLASVASHPENDGDLVDLVRTEASEERSADAGSVGIANLGREAAELRDQLHAKGLHSTLLRASQNLAAASEEARRDGLTHSLQQTEDSFEHRLQSLKSDLHNCDMSREWLSEQVRFTRAKLEAVHSDMLSSEAQQKAQDVNHRALTRKLVDSLQSDQDKEMLMHKEVANVSLNRRIADAALNRVRGRNAMGETALNVAEAKLADAASANTELVSKMQEPDNETAALNITLPMLRKELQTLQAQLTSQRNADAAAQHEVAKDEKTLGDQQEVLMKSAALVAPQLSASEAKERQLRHDVAKAQQFVKKDQQMISRFEERFAELRSQESAACSARSASLHAQQESARGAIRDEIAKARASEHAVAEENRLLTTRILALQKLHVQQGAEALRAAKASQDVVRSFRESRHKKP